MLRNNRFVSVRIYAFSIKSNLHTTLNTLSVILAIQEAVQEILYKKKGRNGCYGEFKSTPVVITNEKYPLSIIDIPKEHPQIYHPTQKPVALLEWLIKTYTNEGETVLDNCFGSGSTLIAAVNCGRACIGFEKETKYFNIAAERLSNLGG